MKNASNPERGWRLGTKLALFMILGTTVIFAVVMWFSGRDTKRVFLKHLKEEVRQVTYANRAEIETVLLGAEKIPAFLAGRLEAVAAPSEAQLIEWCKESVEANPDIYGLAIAYEPFTGDPEKRYYAAYSFRKDGGITSMMFGGDEYQYHYLDWYQIPRELQRPMWSEPFFDEGCGNTVMVTYSVPFYRMVNGERELAGVVSADVELSYLVQRVEDAALMNCGYPVLISRNGVYVTHPDPSVIMRESFFDHAEALGDERLRNIGRDMIHGGEDFITMYSTHLEQSCWVYYAPVPSIGWSLAVVFPEQELYADLNELRNNAATIGLAGFLCFFVMTLLMGRYLTGPVRRITRLADSIAAGDMAGAVKMLPDYHRDAERPLAREYGQLTRAMMAMTRSLSGLLGQVSDAADRVNRCSSELAAHVRELEATVSQQAASTNEVNATSKEISATAGELAGTMSRLTLGTRESAALAESGADSLQGIHETLASIEQGAGGMAGKLEDIRSRTADITKVVTTITTVANQTNLLSLNAAIEAEKAGEHGLGFAVVARQIRHLADQTAVAVLDIEKRISEMLEVVNDGVNAVEVYAEQTQSGSVKIARMSEDLSRIVSHAQDVGPRIESANEGMQIQSQSAGQISDAMEQINASANHTRQALEDFQKMAEELSQAVCSLEQETNRFSLDANETR